MTSTQLVKKLIRLHAKRKSGKVQTRSVYKLTKGDREEILAKTDGRCHICGMDVRKEKWQADHVKNQVSGGEDKSANFLASCSTCNRLRWHYGPEEVQLILKLGVKARREIANETKLGQLMAERFANTIR